MDMEKPIDEDGKRITVGWINSSFWKGYDGEDMPRRASRGSMMAWAWRQGRRWKRIDTPTNLTEIRF